MKIQKNILGRGKNKQQVMKNKKYMKIQQELSKRYEKKSKSKNINGK